MKKGNEILANACKFILFTAVCLVDMDEPSIIDFRILSTFAAKPRVLFFIYDKRERNRFQYAFCDMELNKVTLVNASE